MAGFERVFSTLLYRARLNAARNPVLEKTCRAIAAEDRAGQRWAKAHRYGGYTSYASLDDLMLRASIFAELERDIARHVARFARGAAFDLSGRKLALDSFWINVMEKGAVHTPHIHPHAVVSGTYYIAAPSGSGPISFEDPRLGMMMAAPPRRKTAPVDLRSFVSIAPKPGMLLLWESWLRHGVGQSTAKGQRISVSFNYRLE